MGEEPIVCDTSLLLYLGRIEMATILPTLYREVFVPDKVALELDAGRLIRSDTIDPRRLDWATVVSVSENEMLALPRNQLGIGERSVIAYARTHSDHVAGLDDRSARLFCEQLGIKVVGMVGILVKAKKQMLFPSLRPLLESAHTHGFRISRELYHEALSLAGEKP